MAGQIITLWVADIFALGADDIGHIDAIYDRAALIALPPDVRPKYSEHIRQITPNAPQLLITLDYDQNQKDGPPFSVSLEQVERYYSNHYQVTELESNPSMLNANAALSVSEQVWLLSHRREAKLNA